MKKLLFIICYFTISFVMEGQQVASYGQFNYNKQQINPAYIGYRETFNATLMHRSQWVGFKGAPSTQVLSVETPLKKNEIAAGASFMHDKIGPSNESSLSIDLAYRIRFNRKVTLSFGAKGSLALFQTNLNDVALASDYYGSEDQNFSHQGGSLVIPNVGFGAFLYSGKGYIGLSSPKMLRTKLNKKGTAPFETLNGRNEPVYYLIGGYNFKVNRDLKVQPNLIVKSVVNAPMSIGAHVNFIYMKEITAGVFYHLGESVGIILQWQFKDQWKIGYSVDFAANKLINTNYGSHELMLNYTIKQKRKQIVYPRFF